MNELNLQTPLSGSTALLIIAIGVVVLTILVLLLGMVVVVHHLITDRNRRRNRKQFESAAILLAPYLVDESTDLASAVEKARKEAGDQAVSLVLRRARYDLRADLGGRITTALVKMGAVDTLAKEAKSRREWKRVVAVRGLGECGGEKARGILMEAANDPVPEVRRAARDGLLLDGSAEALKLAISSFLADLPKRAGWRRTFYARLAATSSVALLELIESGNLAPPEQKLALEALGDAGAPDSYPFALARLKDADPELRATATRVIGKLGHSDAVHLVIDRLEDESWFVRSAAARSVEWMAAHARDESLRGWQRRACEALGRHLGDESWWVRANAARALSRQGKVGVQVLFDTAEGKDRYARDAALAALAMVQLDSLDQARFERIIKALNEQAAAAESSFGGAPLLAPQPLGGATV